MKTFKEYLNEGFSQKSKEALAKIKDINKVMDFVAEHGTDWGASGGRISSLLDLVATAPNLPMSAVKSGMPEVYKSMKDEYEVCEVLYLIAKQLGVAK